jgi:RNA-directed DNA polymerase
VRIGDGMASKSERLTQGDLLGPARAVARRTKERKAMAQQKSERRVGAQATRKRGVTRGVECRGGAKATPVSKQMQQLGLRFGTAEESAKAEADGEAARPPSRAATRAEPKPRRREQTVASTTMEDVCEQLENAFQNVARNDGAPGPDRQSIEQAREQLPEVLLQLKTALLSGSYRPGDIRRVWIPKANGGQRGLGIPNVIDRVVQEAVRLVLEPVYEPTFHDGSHGFRPKRSCHSAIAAAKRHIDEGYEWVVDIDLENFFNRVNHQRLMSRLSQRVQDRRILVLIGQLLRARIVMPNGVVVKNEEGVPQGGPLSPLLSNIVLDELDWELDRRGHRFVRYADDENIYVRSERAGQRVMASVKTFIEKRLRLKVNDEKSAVARIEERHFVGFRLRRELLNGDIEVLPSERSRKRIAAKVRELTPRNWGRSLRSCIKLLNVYLRGWMGFFGICSAEVEIMLKNTDAHIRRRLRAIQLKHWKRKRTIARKLIQMGAKRATVRRGVYDGRNSLWALSHCSPVDSRLRNGHWTARGLLSLAALWRASPHRFVVPEQLTLSLG